MFSQNILQKCCNICKIQMPSRLKMGPLISELRSGTVTWAWVLVPARWWAPYPRSSGRAVRPKDEHALGGWSTHRAIRTLLQWPGLLGTSRVGPAGHPGPGSECLFAYLIYFKQNLGNPLATSINQNVRSREEIGPVRQVFAQPCVVICHYALTGDQRKPASSLPLVSPRQH